MENIIVLSDEEDDEIDNSVSAHEQQDYMRRHFYNFNRV